MVLCFNSPVFDMALKPRETAMTTSNYRAQPGAALLSRRFF